MFIRFTPVLLAGALGLASACAPTPEPTPIYADPTYDKFGTLQCTPDPRQPVPYSQTGYGQSSSQRTLPNCCPTGYYMPDTGATSTPFGQGGTGRQMCVRIPDDQPRDRPRDDRQGQTGGIYN